jgi:peptidoglycan/LPS O-acetylase OafA/YrhL
MASSSSEGRTRPRKSVSLKLTLPGWTNEKGRNIPSLDGMRAVSIILVIVAHSAQHFIRWIRIPSRSYLLLAHTGVSVFFVISGFLITSLLLKELQEEGMVHLRRFYLRRAFRIFPPFYVYLGVILVLALVGLFHTPLRVFFFAATYTLNFYFGSGGAFVGVQHIWSLCVEEQFYLLWPAALVFVGRQRAIYVAVFLILASPFVRVITYAMLAPQHRAVVNRMFHSSIDTIMFGCLLALLGQSSRLNMKLDRCANHSTFALACFFLCFLDPLLDLRFHGRYDLTVGMTLEGICICLITLYVIRRPKGFPGRILNLPALRHVGIISYGLYLWQNIFTGESSQFFPFNLGAIFVCAEVSYWVVERPSLRLRDRQQKEKTCSQQPSRLGSP